MSDTAAQKELPENTVAVFDLDGSAPVARWEWIALALLCAACLGFWFAHYHAFVVPSSDYFSIERLSREIWSFSAPSKFKRMPLFPLLMGLLGKLMPGESPELQAALALNIAFSIAGLALAFVFMRNAIGPLAFVPLVLLAANNTFTRNAVHPLVEPIMGFTILLTLVLFQKRSRWAYLAAFFAALTRYEASALIAVMFALDWVYEKKPLKSLGLSALASAGFLVWMGLSMSHHSGGNPYLNQMSEMGWKLKPKFLVTVLSSLSIPGAEIPALAVILVGVGVSLKKFSREAWALLAFLLLYLAAHVAFGVDRSRYTYPITWIIYFYFTVAAAAIVGAVWRLLATRRRAWLGPAALALGTGMLAYALVKTMRHFKVADAYAPAWVYAAVFGALLAGLFACCVAAVRKPALIALAVAAGFTAIATPLAGRGISLTAGTSWMIYYRKYSSYVAGKWIAENLGPNEKALVMHEGLSSHYGDIDDSRLVSFGHLEASSLDEMIPELAERGITHVIYSHRRKPRKDNARDRYYWEEFDYSPGESGRDPLAGLPVRPGGLASSVAGFQAARGGVSGLMRLRPSFCQDP